MNSNEDSKKIEEILEELDDTESGSIDDFIKELEAKEKDLHISSEMVIEIDDADFDDQNIPDFVKTDIPEPILHAPNTSQMGGFSSLGGLAADKKALSELKDEVLRLQQRISKTEGEKIEIIETMRRRQIDFDSYKKRTERDRGETFLSQIGNLVTQMLPVLDNLNRALDSADHLSGAKSREFQQFFDGIVLVNQQLNEVFAEMGVQPIASTGEYFDPYFHEAVAADDDETFPPNTVIEELLRGYRIGDKVIRASMVKVSASTKKKAAEVSPDKNGQSVDNLTEAE